MKLLRLLALFALLANLAPAEQTPFLPLPVEKFTPVTQAESILKESNTYNSLAALWMAEMPQLLQQTRESGRADLVSPSGFTALHYAAMHGDLKLAEELLSKGADVNARATVGQGTYFGNAAIGFALGCSFLDYPGRAQMLRLLLQHGAALKTDIVYMVPSTYSGFCSQWNKIASGSCLNLQNLQEREECLHVVLDFAPKDAKKLLQERILYWPAVMGGNRYPLSVVERLLENGANPDASDEKDLTALKAAAREGDVERVKLLLRYGADPNDYTYRYFGAPLFMLHKLIRKKEVDKAIEIATLLLDHGADIDAMNRGESLRISYGKIGTPEALKLCEFFKSRGAVLHPDSPSYKKKKAAARKK